MKREDWKALSDAITVALSVGVALFSLWTFAVRNGWVTK